MYWHGTANRGWSRQPPTGVKETGEKSSAKKAATSVLPPRPSPCLPVGVSGTEAMVSAAGPGRPPKATNESGAVSFDAAAGCYRGANGMYWHGTANGGWSRQPPTGVKETGEKSSAKRAKVDEPEAAEPRGRPACGHVEHRWP